MKRVIVGIDPDTKKSGVIIVYTGEKKGRFFEHETHLLDYFDLFDKLNELHEIYRDALFVVVEQGEQNHHIWNAK